MPTTTSPSIRLAACLAILIGVMTSGCAAAASLSLTDREFLSTAITDGGAPFALAPGTRIRLNFTKDGLGASAGCNSIGGTYRIDGGRLVFDGASMTEMACEPPRDAQDQWLITFLGSKPVVQLVGTDLTLDNGRIVVRLVDRTVAEPDLNIVGPTWTVTSIIDGDAVSSIPEGVTATLVFKADGTIDVNAGCNRGGGKWAIDGAGIAVKDVFLTKMACDGPAAALESAVLAVLNVGSIAAEIKSSTLTLQAGGHGLQLQGS